MNTYVIYNKKSNNNHGATGAFKIKELWTNKNLIYKELNEFSTYEELFKSIAPDDEVVLCGGDGTLNFLVNEVDCENVPIVVMTVQGTYDIQKNFPWHKSHVEMHIAQVLSAEEIKGKKTAELGNTIADIMLKDLGGNAE